MPKALARLPCQLAKFASKPDSSCQSIRGLFSPLSSAAAHLRQKRISFSQWPAVIAGTSAVNGKIGSAHGFSPKKLCAMR